MTADGAARGADDGPADGTDDAAADGAAVLDGLRAGDEAVFARVVTDWSPGLLRLARLHVPTSSAAEDVVQETWLAVLRGLPQFEGRSTLRTWVCGICLHLARRSGVRERRVLPFSAAWRDERAPAVDPERFAGPEAGAAAGSWSSPPTRWHLLPEEQLAERELRDVVDAAIAALPARQRAVLTARDVLGLSAAEVCELHGLSDGNQRVVLHRARARVRSAVEDYARRSA